MDNFQILQTQVENMTDILKLHELLAFISSHSDESLDALKELHTLIKGANPHLIVHSRPVLIGTLYRFIQKPTNFKNDVKTETINILMEIFKKLKTDNVGFYFNISGFLLGEIYDPKEKNFG